MLCDTCEYLYHPECESNYTSCSVFGDSVPEQYERKDGMGCICNKRQLAKIQKENEEAWLKEARAFNDWHLRKDGIL